MRVFTVVMAFALLLAVSCASTANVTDLDAAADIERTVTTAGYSNAWNTYCSDCNFLDWSYVTPTTALGDLYVGNNFGADVWLFDLQMTNALGKPAGLNGSGVEALYVWYDDDDPWNE